MDHDDSGARAERFATYIANLGSVLGDPRRHGPMTSYCTGLLMPADRKSVEPMAAMTAPERTAAQHQSLLHFVGKGDWSDDAVMAKIREHVVARIATHGAISAWIIDDTGFPKKGRHSVGVARQYCGQLGKQDNCQVAVSLSIAVVPKARASSTTITRACRSPIACICPRAGQKIPSVVQKPACLRILRSKRNRKSRSIRSNGPALPGCRAAMSWPMPVMERTRGFDHGSPSSACATSWA